jgi:superfamily II DNA or RNA helicase
MDALFRAIRESCSAATWSKGVVLARAGAVVPSRTTDDTIEVRVTSQGSLVAPEVSLYPEDEDWVCECNSQEDVCAHVAAAVIAVRQAQKTGKPLESESVAARGKLAYRLTRRGDKLQLTRVVVVGDDESVLFTSLAAASNSESSPRFVASQQDLAFEALCGSYSGGDIPTPLVAKLFSALTDAPDLTLDGKPARIADPSSGMAVRVEDCAVGYRLRLEQDPAIDEVFANGALRRGDELLAVCEHGINERLFQELRHGKIFERSEVGNLVGEVLPALDDKVRVIVESASLPHASAVPARLQIRSQRQGDMLKVLATVIYGNPPCARVDGNQLTLLSGTGVPRRSYREETHLRRLLREELDLEAGTEKNFEGRAAFDMARRVAELDDPRILITGDAHERFHVTAPLRPRLRVSADGGVDVWFAPEEGLGGTGSERGRADPRAVLQAWQRGDEHAPLLEGGFGALPLDWLQRFGHHLTDLLATRDAMRAGTSDATLPAFAYSDLAALCEATAQELPEQFRVLETLARDFTGIPAAELPGDLAGNLRGYQRDGVDWLSFLRDVHLGALLADDMGLGKTIQTLCATRGRTLVVAPRSVLHNWQAEVQRFRPGLRVHTYHGPNRSLDATADITLTTYAVLRLDADQLVGRHWDTVVLDESQAIKNPHSQVSRAAHRLRADFRVALTGTPVENRLDDLWSQFQFVNPGLLGSHSSFRERYVRPIDAGDTQAADRLRQRLRLFILRRLKREVAPELPPRTELVLRCELDEVERKVYDAVRAATRDEVVNKLAQGANTIAVLEALLRLRQAACHASLVPGQATLRDEASSKVRLLLDTLEVVAADGHKALVFSQWTSLLDRVAPHLEAAGLGFVRLDGSTRDRKGVVDAFQTLDGPPVMLLSLKAGGTGLNLTAADHVFLLDPWWNPAVEDQAADRAHRIGQDKPVFIHRLIAEETVEERILALQERKRELARTAVGVAATSISRDELLALLQ